MAGGPTSFRGSVSADSEQFKPESGRYHLYVHLGCPFAARTLVVRKLKGLEAAIGVTYLDELNQHPEKGWKFFKDQPDPLHPTFEYMSELYFKADPKYAGRFTVPLLWDKKLDTAVNSESGDIIVMFNNAFNDFCATDEQKNLDLYPANQRAEIDALINRIQSDVNLGVYKCGRATDQETYDKNVTLLFQTLDYCDDLLSKTRFLLGNKLTLADVRLFTTLLRFDIVYHTLFKCNKRKIAEYPQLREFMRDIYNLYGVSETYNRHAIMTGYYNNFASDSNPSGVVAVGPDVDLSVPVQRRARFA